MTPDEQRVYAEMGISPLVLSDAEAQDARNSLISVVLPGEKSAVAVQDATPASSPTTAVKAAVADPVPNANATPTLTVADQPQADHSETTAASVEMEESQANGQETKVRRRRRRRSSASTDNSEE